MMESKNVDKVEILLVEDNPNDAALFIRALNKNNLGRSFIICEDGEEALDFLMGRGKFKGKNGIDFLKVIFLDLKLPKINGIEVLKTLKSDEVRMHLPIVVFSSSRELSDVNAAYSCGANSYVVKPVGFEDYMKVISEMGLYWLTTNETPNTV